MRQRILEEKGEKLQMDGNIQSQEERKVQIMLVESSLNNIIQYNEKILESYRVDSPYY